MNIEKRVEILENNFINLIKKLNNDTFYQSADVAGVRKEVADVTPYTETKTAYIGDTEVAFDVPEGTGGHVTVFIEDSEGNYPLYTLERTGDRITVTFEPLEYVTTITISII